MGCRIAAEVDATINIVVELNARGKSFLQSKVKDLKDVRIGSAGSRATQSRQPRQVRKEATVTG